MNVTSTLTESTVLQACRTLFGQEPDIGSGFLYYLQPSGAKSAYRKKAKETHPDFYQNEDLIIQQQQTILFRGLLEAYDILNRFFKERDEGLWRPAPASGERSGTKRTAAQQKSKPAGHDKASTSRKQNNDDYYRGPIPYRVLEFGRYLYYSGHVTYWSLIEALVWQRKQRPLIGGVALRWGWLSQGAVDQIVAANTVPGRFGEKAVSLGLLSDFQVKTLLYYQRTQQERLGKYFVLNELLTGEQLELLVRKLNEHNALVLTLRKRAQRPGSAFA